MVFTSTINTPDDVRKIRPVLNRHERIDRWCVDLDDWEKVLKIESRNGLSHAEIERLMDTIGYECREMHH